MVLNTETVEDFDAATRIEQLRHEIEQHSYNYYVLDAPTISDGEWDMLMRELRDLEERFPELRSEDSPTVRVGGQVAQGFQPHRHPRPMLSLANAFTHDELEAWLQRIRNIVPNATVKFVAEPKIDGLAIALTYEHGVLKVGATRGNGIEGENVTANLRTVRTVPHRLSGTDIPERVEVRGEIYMDVEGFERLNERRAAEGSPLFANPRNAAAGSLRQLDPNVTRSRPLNLFAYQIGWVDGMRLQDHWQALLQLRDWGFVVNPLVEQVDGMAGVHTFCKRLQEERDRLAYEIDGAVVKVSSIALQEELGAVGREPRWAIAFKFPPRQATTRLIDIQVNVGRTGSINPFAVLEPVTVGGVEVRLATLHNEQDIQRKDIRVGDRVIVHRAGDVIPQVVKPVVEERDGSQQTYHLPENCPSCGTGLVRPDDEAMTRCPNLECPAQRFRWIEHFVSEPAMDIRGLGERLAQLFLDAGLIRDPADLYALTAEQLLGLPGFKEKSVSNLLRAIENSINQPLNKVIFALGIRYVCDQTAQLLADAFGDLDEILDASSDRLAAVDGVGKKTADSVVLWAQHPTNRRFADRLRAAGLTWQQTRPQGDTGPLDGVTLLITGRLESLTRGQAEEQLQELGARIASGMNKSVDHLIVGADPGSKLDRAIKLGTPIHNEEWLQMVLQQRSIPPSDAK
ncbi:MAG: NAD-dependent DNA ligase LigA [Chloroflexota bacterium]